MGKPITAVIVGAGHRSMKYATYAQKHPDRLQITGVVDPNPLRRQSAAELYQLPENHCFEDVGSLTAADKIADFAINGTMDKLHISTSLPLLKAGYHLLLEKPISTNKQDLIKLLAAARQYERKVLICHVLRYASAYRRIKEEIIAGSIGDILSINAAEYIQFDHYDCAFIRGKWGNSDKCGSELLMSKSCHDLDIISWLMSGIRPVRVASFGSLQCFKAENAPANAGKRCALDCPIEGACEHSAIKIYMKQKRWSFYAWESIEHLGGKNAPDDVKINSLKTDNPYGRCVWKCDNNINDHQTTIIEYENGTTATFNLCGGAMPGNRPLRVTGTKGELEISPNGEILLRTPDLSLPDCYRTQTLAMQENDDDAGGSGHSGDLGLVGDFVKILSGCAPSVSATSLEDSIYGHLIGFTADIALKEKRVAEIEQID